MMTSGSKLDQRIATAEGSYQAERYRRERVEQKLDRRNVRIRELEQDVEALRAVVENAPHERGCILEVTEAVRSPDEPWVCTCWKADAL